MQTFAFILILVVAVIASHPLVRVVRVVPLPVLQIMIGMALAWPVTGGVHVELEPEVFLLIFIPPLLFGDAWQAPKRELWEMRFPIAWLAFGLVFFTIVAFGYALHWLVPAVPLVVAFAAAAVLSPTDAVAVSSIIDKERLPPRLLHLLEGESLLNDASGLVMFRFAVAAALTGSFSLTDAGFAFVLAVVVGVVCGFISIAIAAKALKILAKLKSDAAEAQVLVMIILPFLAYLLAEHLHASGVLAAVIAGMFASRSGLPLHLGISARMLTASAWQMLGFVLNGAIFVFLGLQLPAIIRSVPAELTTQHWLIQPVLVIVALTVCLMALRFAFMAGGNLVGQLMVWFLRKPRIAFGAHSRLISAVAGVRGAVTLAGVLSLPQTLLDGSPFPARDLVIFLATGVIICWLAIATFVLPYLVKGLEYDGHQAAASELRRARIAAAQAAIAALEGAVTDHQSDPSAVTPRQAVAEALISSYRRRIAALEEGASMREEVRATQQAEVALRNTAAQAEADALRHMLLRGEINDHTIQTIFRELTLSQAVIQTKS